MLPKGAPMTMIPPETQAEILSLHFGKKKGTRSIARILGVNRKAVRRVVEHRKVSLKPESSKNKRSILDPFKPRLEQLLKQDPSLTSIRMMQLIRGEGYFGVRAPNWRRSYLDFEIEPAVQFI